MADGRLDINAGEAGSTVIIVDDDRQVLTYLSRLLDSVGIDTVVFSDSKEFLVCDLPESPCCIILDVRMPGISGHQVHERLLENGIDIPVIFLTAHSSVEAGVESMKRGAVDYIEKPFEDQRLLDAVNMALRISRSSCIEKSETARLRQLFDALTDREQDVFWLVVDGLPNKQIASELDISMSTVKIHRSRAMHKMKAESVADLVKMSQSIERHSTKA